MSPRYQHTQIGWVIIVSLVVLGAPLGPTLRGRFRLEGLGDGKVFVQADRPPFVLVRLQQGFVLVGFESTTSTRTLYDTLVAATEQPP